MNPFNVQFVSTSAKHPDGTTVNINPIEEINGEKIGFNVGVEREALKGKFRLMNGKIYKILNEVPPTSHFIRTPEMVD